MPFALVAFDRVGQTQKRLDLRPDHLKFLDSLGDRLLLAGPFLAENGDMVGSIVIIEAESYEAARAEFARDPYAVGGLFESVTVKPYKIARHNLK